MGSTKLEKLSFVIDLMDRVSKPLKNICSSVEGTIIKTQDAYEKIGTGIVGIGAAGLAMQQLVAPAVDFNRAFGDVKSLDVSKQALGALEKQALQFAVKYGESATDFVSSSYDIQSAIGGLQGADLANSTTAAGILAKGIKASSATITDYMGTMYGVFKDNAEKMGKSNWVEDVAGKTAKAVQMFKTNGGKWAQAWSGLGASATAAGVKMEEQMAVLGTLQMTMGGGEAATKYKAFLQGAAGAQKKLGMSFVDSNGQLLGMTEILTKLRGKFGDTISAAEGVAIKEAFGSDEAVGLINLLMKDTDGLTESIRKLEAVNGMDNAKWMAGQRTDLFARWSAGMEALRIGFGKALLPVLNPVLEGLVAGVGTLTEWTQEFPAITRWIGYGAITIITMTGALGALAAACGIARMAVIGWSTATAISTKIVNAAKWALGKFQAVTWAVNAAMAANPVGLWIIGMTALVAGVAAAVYWWDDLKAAFLDTSWGQAIINIFDKVLGYIKKLSTPFSFVADLASKIGFTSSDVSPNVEAPAMLNAPKQAQVAPGGVTNHIVKSVSNAQTNQRHIGAVNITTNKGIDGHTLTNELLLGT